jgi:hypothetical protein
VYNPTLCRHHQYRRGGGFRDTRRAVLRSTVSVPFRSGYPRPTRRRFRSSDQTLPYHKQMYILRYSNDLVSNIVLAEIIPFPPPTSAAAFAGAKQGLGRASTGWHRAAQGGAGWHRVLHEYGTGRPGCVRHPRGALKKNCNSSRCNSVHKVVFRRQPGSRFLRPNPWSNHIPGKYVVKLRDGTSADTLKEVLDISPGDAEHVRNSGDFVGFASKLEGKDLTAVRANPDVDFVEQHAIVTIKKYVTQSGAPWGPGADFA